jgi:hypothetical protein
MKMLRRWLIARGIRQELRFGARFRIQRDRLVDEMAMKLADHFGVSDAIADLPIRGFVGKAPPHGKPALKAPGLAPGRQTVTIVMPGQSELFGPMGPDPFSIPDDARSAKWESKHLFPAGGKLPTRGWFGLQCPEPPLALECPDCSLKQPALDRGHRRCGYCGVSMMAHGTRIYWWREALEVEGWKP